MIHHFGVYTNYMLSGTHCQQDIPAPESRLDSSSPLGYTFPMKRSSWSFLLLLALTLPPANNACKSRRAEPSAAHPPSVQDPGLPGELGGRIVFQSDRCGNWDIFSMNADGSDIVRLTHDSASDEYPVWSPDGRHIAFKSNRTGRYQIYIMEQDGKNRRQITFGSADNEDPGWSPDGRRIAFQSKRTGTAQLFVMNSDGSSLRPLTTTIGKNGHPDWSPDGRAISFTGNRFLGWNVYRMNADGSEDKRLTDGHGACRPDWSPDGRKIAFVSQKADGKGDIWIMDPEGKSQFRLTDDDQSYDYHPAWSPDGRYLAFAKSSHKQKGNWEIHVITVDGTRFAPLTRHPGQDSFPDWKK